MSSREVLICGASIAGPALAFWLHHHGMQATVVERAPALRPGGQTVDLRGVGRVVAERMGIVEAVRAASTGEAGIRFVDGSERTRAEFGVDAFGGEGIIAELEILRGQLSALLYEQTSGYTEYVFGDEVTGIVDDSGQVQVTFAHGEGRTFDLVIAADGARSRTRDLVFGDTTRVRELGQCMAYFTIPREESDGAWARCYNATGGRMIALRPDNEGTTKALMSFPSRSGLPRNLDRAAQESLLHRTFADAGWQASRVLVGMEQSPDFYLESIAQVRMPRWSRGRVGVVGDAAYCASPITGQGTALALAGAYVLAGELGSHADHRDAFASYESNLRPYVASAQRIPPGKRRLTAPHSALGITLYTTALRVAASPRLERIVSRLSGSATASRYTLPTY